MIKALTIALFVVLTLSKAPKLGDNVDDCAYFITNLKEDITSLLQQIAGAKLKGPVNQASNLFTTGFEALTACYESQHQTGDPDICQAYIQETK